MDFNKYTLKFIMKNKFGFRAKIYSTLIKLNINKNQINSLINEQQQKINSFNSLERIITMCSLILAIVSIIISTISAYCSIYINNYLSILPPAQRVKELESFLHTDLFLAIQNILLFFRSGEGIGRIVLLLFFGLFALWIYKRILNKQLKALYTYQRFLQSETQNK